MNKTKTLLEEEIQTEFEKLREMEVGSEQHKVAVDGLTKLMDREIEIGKVYLEEQDKIATREADKRNQLVKDSIAIGSVLLYAGLAVWGTKASFQFERDGTITTLLGRGWINKLLPKK